VAVPVSAIIGLLERIAPRRLALEGDRERTGLAVGSPASLVERVMVALDPTPEAVAEAVAARAGLLVTHHPLIFHSLSSVRTDTPLGRVIAAAVAKQVAIFAAHTNLDVAEGGVSSVLAERLGLTEVEVLAETERERLLKLVVFVPESHAEAVRQAMGDAGAGQLGRYSHCAFLTQGTGTFLPQAGSCPYLGRAGVLERVAEVRVETLLPASLLEEVLRAMRRVHPYEEVAYDLYALQNTGAAVGLGRIGRLLAEQTVARFAETVKAALGVERVACVGEAERAVRKVAVCGGSGGDLVPPAVCRGADVLVVGEAKYHDGLLARQEGLALIAAGHDATERLVVPVLAKRLRRAAEEAGLEVDFLAAGPGETLWRTV
jgi:dinuclear metal center YbgI/SA1388 family protein